MMMVLVHSMEVIDSIDLHGNPEMASKVQIMKDYTTKSKPAAISSSFQGSILG
ncbi:hypothetical protein Patl1_29481 [Pistacia atlantica]|uniref:Uncharacterized protein n=1 Tax=Pistacia atlantica TaxID=434234 RepID=A0ACC1AAV4_9ROSI|nr:hypothetical protein Patl1_29481 [Pistacia atlantica]